MRGFVLFPVLFVAVIAASACAPRVSLLRGDAEDAGRRLSEPVYTAMFPVAMQDFNRTVEQGEGALKTGNVEEADSYFRFALIKAEVLQKDYLEQLQRREAEARQQLELKLKAEAELELQKKQEEERLAEQAREAARLKAAEAARRKIERPKPEREQPLVARYTVKRGETLPQIAAQPEVYGDSSLWPLIYRANRDQISDPSVLWPGQSLRIPRNNDRSDLNEARRFAVERPLR